jgi:hypothetical protein
MTYARRPGQDERVSCSKYDRWSRRPTITHCDVETVIQDQEELVGVVVDVPGVPPLVWVILTSESFVRATMRGL